MTMYRKPTPASPMPEQMDPDENGYGYFTHSKKEFALGHALGLKAALQGSVEGVLPGDHPSRLAGFNLGLHGKSHPGPGAV